MINSNTIYEVAARASFLGNSIKDKEKTFYGNKNPPDIDFEFRFEIVDLQDKAMESANSFFTDFFASIPDDFRALDLLHVELLTIPAILPAIIGTDPATYEPEWMQQDKIYYFKDWKLLEGGYVANGNRPPLVANKSSFNFYLSYTSGTGFHKSFSLAQIRNLYKDKNLNEVSISVCNHFKQVIGVSLFYKETDSFYTFPFKFVRKLTMRQKVRAYLENSLWFDKLLYWYTIPAQIVYGISIAIDRLVLLYKKEISIWDLSNIPVEVLDYKLKLKLAKYATPVYLFVIIEFIIKHQ